MCVSVCVCVCVCVFIWKMHQIKLWLYCLDCMSVRLEAVIASLLGKRSAGVLFGSLRGREHTE